MRKIQKLRDSVRGQLCVNCEWTTNIDLNVVIENETTVLAHLAPQGFSGMGMKGPDYMAAGLCAECHRKADQDPAYISDWHWRYRMVARQWQVWMHTGVISIG